MARNLPGARARDHAATAAPPEQRPTPVSKRRPLENYHRKRNFDRTPEPCEERPARETDRPSSRRSRTNNTPKFVVQRHAARRLHYDFRLELDGVLKSWAVPKGPSRDPRVKRLAVETEDHPLAYATFEGEIPSGNYGAGHVEIWDAGSWSPPSDAAAALERGHLRFALHGSTLRGDWLLVRTGQTNQWLLRKIDDAHAIAGDDIDAIERDDALRKAPANLDRSKSGAMPDVLYPQLAVLAARPPEGPGWVYELKYDGYRMLCRASHGTVPRFVSRQGNDWTDRMAPLARALASLLRGQGWIDGEIVVFDQQGRSSFQALQRALDGSGEALHFIAFDLLWWNGRDLRHQPLHERHDQLVRVLADVPAGSPVSVADRLDIPDAATARAALTDACRLGFEGLIAKQEDAGYVSDRARTWLKLKCRPRQEFVVGGYTSPRGSRQGFGSLLLGLFQHGQFRFAGRVGSGFTQRAIEEIQTRLRTLRTERCPFTDPPTDAGRTARREATCLHWVRPELVVEVAFSEWTSDGLLRQASFQGIREDKAVGEITTETADSGPTRQEASTMQPRAPSQPATHQRVRKAQPARGRSTVAGVHVTHPDRLVYTSPPITKLQVAQYYHAIAPYLMPHIVRRRLAFLRCPEGLASECFFQKHIAERLPQGLARDGEHILVRNARGLVELAQRGVIELHTWGSSLPRSDRPDRLTLDLDPGPGVDWPALVEAALLTSTLVRELGLQPFLKSTGGKGLHLVMPIRRTIDWQTAKGFAAGIARHLAAHLPDRFTANMARKHRVGRIFVDYLRNGEQATAIAAYSLRARQGAPVAVPLRWEELTPNYDLRANAFNLFNVLERVQSQGDPWEGYNEAAVAVTRKMLDQMA